MNPQGFRSITVTVLLLCASVAIVAASAIGLRFGERHDLTIAIIDARHELPGRQYLCGKVANAVRMAVNASYRSNVRVRSIIASARDVKLRLEKGGYDAVLIVGSDRPMPSTQPNLITLAGSLAANTSHEPVCLMVSKSDPTLSARMEEVFSRLLAQHLFYANSAPSTPFASFATVDQ